MGMFDYLPEIEANCPRCGISIVGKPQTKNLKRTLTRYTKNDSIPYPAYGCLICNDCNELFWILTKLDKDSKIKGHETYREVCPFLRTYSTISGYEPILACWCDKDEPFDNDVKSHECACVKHETNGKHCECGNHPCSIIDHHNKNFSSYEKDDIFEYEIKIKN